MSYHMFIFSFKIDKYGNCKMVIRPWRDLHFCNNSLILSIFFDKLHQNITWKIGRTLHDPKNTKEYKSVRRISDKKQIKPSEILEK